MEDIALACSIVLIVVAVLQQLPTVIYTLLPKSPAVPDARLGKVAICMPLRGAYRFMQIQNLWVRMYHPRWWLTFGHFAPVSLTMIPVTYFLFDALLQSDSVTAAWTAVSLTFAVTSLLVGLALLEWRIRKTIRANGDTITNLPLSALLKLPIATPLTQLTFFAAVFWSVMTKEVEWRGISYTIRGRFDVRMKSYQPFYLLPMSTENAHSI